MKRNGQEIGEIGVQAVTGLGLGLVFYGHLLPHLFLQH